MLAKLAQLITVPDLRKRVIIITFLLVAFRLLAQIPIPEVDALRMRELMAQNQALGAASMLMGGTLDTISIVMLGVGPYITATIILQLLTMIFPQLKAAYYEEGAMGRAKFNRLARQITVPLAALQSYSLLRYLAAQNVISNITPLDFVTNTIIVTAGSMILLWIGELIEEQKLGSGISLIIFAGIVSSLPAALYLGYEQFTTGTLRPDTLVAFVVLALLVVTGVVLVNEAERKIPVSYAKQMHGSRTQGGIVSYLPLRVNQAGVIPIIFAVSLLMFPQIAAQIALLISPAAGASVQLLATQITTNQLVYGTLYFTLVFVFTYFYTSVVFNPSEIAKNLQRSGGFIPGMRPGAPTAGYLGSIVSRITLFGALFLASIAVLPIITQSVTKTQNLAIGGTALLIVVSVALETAKQVDSQLKIREYELA